MTTELAVRSSKGTYDCVIGAGLLTQIGDAFQSLGIPLGSVVFVVTDETVQRIGYSDLVAENCKRAGYTVVVSSISPGDESKSLSVAESLYNQMLDATVRRNGTVVAVGGGVVGDLAGFVAATYLRGVRFVQVPTTLLAHDSSIGGKVGVNLARGKNLVGAFHPPRAVLYDVDTLASLPEREWQGGMAEVIKHGIIGDAALFEELEHAPVCSFPGTVAVETLLARACKVKIDIVEQDERESELRMLLNVGHTVGHAVERLSHYELNHGAAVAIGLVIESQIACARGWLSTDDRDRIIRTLAAHHLPIQPPDYALDSIVQILNLDKKHGDGAWTFALPRAIGHVSVARDVKYQEVKDAWEWAAKERTNR